MNNLIEQINGKKTYIITSATALYCLIGVVLHYMSIPMALSLIGTAGSMAALRHGVSKVQGILELITEILKVIGDASAPKEPIAPVVPVAPIVETPTQ